MAMLDPASLSAGTVVVLVITKAFEKTGEKLAESVFKLAESLLRKLEVKYPSLASRMNNLVKSPQLLEKPSGKQEVQSIAAELDRLATQDSELGAEIQSIVNMVRSQPTVIQNIGQLAEKIGILIQGGQQNINISNFNV